MKLWRVMTGEDPQIYRFLLHVYTGFGRGHHCACSTGTTVKPTHWISQIPRFIGPTCGPSRANRTQVGPMLAPWTLLPGMLHALILDIALPASQLWRVLHVCWSCPKYFMRLRRFLYVQNGHHSADYSLDLPSCMKECISIQNETKKINYVPASPITTKISRWKAFGKQLRYCII